MFISPIMSMGEIADMGYRSVFENEGGYLDDVVTGEVIPMRRPGNLYTIRMWVRGVSEDKPGQGFAHGK